MIIRKVTLSFLILVFVLSANAQMKLVPLKTNPVLKNYWRNNPLQTAKINAATDTLVLPFIDDFSYDAIYPSSDYWCDSDAYINSSFAISPPSIGVATMDGLDKTGDAYDTISANAIGLCDKLTSKYINTFSDPQNNPYDSVQMIFFFERKGLGNNVEFKDSLVLQFWDAVALTWTNVWSKQGGVIDTVFAKVSIILNQTKWMQPGFRFRFMNYGSKSGNEDHWHLDYVLLRKIILNSSLNIDDVAWTYRTPWLLKDYSSIPWKHYKNYGNKSALMKNDITLSIHNINTDANNIRNVSKSDSILDGNGGFLYTPFIGGNANNVDPDVYQAYTYPLNGFTFPTNVQLSDDAANFFVTDRLSTFPDLRSENNVMSYTQRFYNYYSYDDGTAEAGLSLLAPNSKAATKYNFLEPDTIRGIKIFWAQMADYAGTNNMKVVIWKDIFTDSIIYQKFGLTPDYVDSINGFALYNCDQVVPVSGTIYVGVVFQLDKNYNLGVDLNTDNHTNNFVNFSGSWQTNPLALSYMIRPLVGDSTVYALVPEQQLFANEIAVYPNPANDFITIKSAEKNITYTQIVDVTGRIYSLPMDAYGRINIANLSDGLYFITAFDSRNKIVGRKKFVKV